MRFFKIPIGCRARVATQRFWLAPFLITGLCLMLGSVAPAFSQEFEWTGDGADNRWDNPENWSPEEVPEFGDVLISFEAEGANGPLIEDGIEALAGVLIGAGGDPVMTMTGGSLELTGWGVWWGDWADTMATFNMSGGEISGAPTVEEIDVD